MKLILVLTAAATPAVVSAKRVASPNTELPAANIKAATKTGNRILSKARRLDGGDADQTWISGYSLKFHSCVASQDYYGGYFADQDGNGANNYNYNNADGNYDGQYNANYQNGEYNANAYGDNGDNNYNGNGYYNNEERNDYQGMYQQKLVHFKLCPSDSCWSCKNGADYVVELNDYVDAILEAKMTAQEYKCEQVRENCNCDGASSEESCQYSCFQNAGLDECAEAMYDNEFDVQEAIECMQVEIDEDIAKSFYMNADMSANQANGNYYAQNGENGGDMDKLYIGPYCSANGKKVLLGAFRDETCSFPAPDGIYEAVNYGESLPYAKKSMVDSGCITCKVPREVDYENYYDQNQEPDEVTDACAALYEVAGKCEEGLEGYMPYRDNMGCNFISTLKTSSILSMPSANIPAKVFAGIFAVTTAALAALSLVLFKRNNRQNVSLAGDAVIS